jgi:hypothetical protein
MTLELSESQRLVLEETRRADTVAEFQTLLDGAKTEMGRVVHEVFEPAQALSTTLTEARDLYLSVREHRIPLAAVKYDGVRGALFRDAIRLLDTAAVWFGEGDRTGTYRVRTVAEVVEASRPWRARIAAIGGQAFVFEPALADAFADVNSSGTLDEERDDLVTLNALVEQHRARLEPLGLTAALVAQGLTLQREAEGRDLAGVLGLRSRDEALTLRNRLATYVVALAREARAAGINGCFDDAAARARFESASFRDALRRLRGRRRRKAADAEGDAPPAPPAGGGEKPNG